MLDTKKYPIDEVLELYKNVIGENATFTRFNVWDFCHKKFVKYRGKNKSKTAVKNLCLTLAYYLASWGMYRGSGYILHYDQTFYKRVINVVFDEKYNPLWDLQIDTFESDDELVELLFGKNGLYDSIEQALSVPERGYKPSETLVTKVILGVFGCCPAFDEVFKEGFFCLNEEMKGKRLRAKYRGFLEFARKNKDKFSENQVPKKLKKYPIMKLVDMYYWYVGLEITATSTEEGSEKKRLREFLSVMNPEKYGMLMATTNRRPRKKKDRTNS